MSKVYTIKDKKGNKLKFSISSAYQLLQNQKLQKIFSSQDNNAPIASQNQAIDDSNNNSIPFLKTQFIMLLLLLLLVVGFLTSIVLFCSSTIVEVFFPATILGGCNT